MSIDFYGAYAGFQAAEKTRESDRRLVLVIADEQRVRAEARMARMRPRPWARPIGIPAAQLQTCA